MSQHSGQYSYERQCRDGHRAALPGANRAGRAKGACAPLSRQRGFSLVEVMIATGISALLVLAASAVYDLNRKTNIKNSWRFSMEDSVRFAMEIINDKIKQAGHTFCGEIRDYDPITAGATGYTDGNNLLYQNKNAANPMTKLQGYDGDTSSFLAVGSWSPNLPTALAANEFDVDEDMDAILIRSLGKHILQLAPSTASESRAGGGLCNSGNVICNFRLFIDNPLIDSTLSFDVDPMFFDVTYASSLFVGASYSNAIDYPIAITDCSATNQMVFTNFTRDGAATIASGTEVVWSIDSAGDGIALPLPITNDANPRVYLHAANLDLIFVDDDGVLSYTRPGQVQDAAVASVGINVVGLTPPSDGSRGDVIVTGFRALYGTVTAAGLPNGFLRPGDIPDAGAWDSVRMVRYAFVAEIVNYFDNNRARPATNLLDDAIAADNSPNLRRIYEQIVFINN